MEYAAPKGMLRDGMALKTCTYVVLLQKAIKSRHTHQGICLADLLCNGDN